jgi:hypothetical protein
MPTLHFAQAQIADGRVHVYELTWPAPAWAAARLIWQDHTFPVVPLIGRSAAQARHGTEGGIAWWNRKKPAGSYRALTRCRRA